MGGLRGTDRRQTCKVEAGREQREKSDMESVAWNGKDRGTTWKWEAYEEHTVKSDMECGAWRERIEVRH